MTATRSLIIKTRLLPTSVLLIAILATLIAYAAPAMQVGTGQAPLEKATIQPTTDRPQNEARYSPPVAPSASLFLPVVTYDTGGTGSSLPFGGNRVAIADLNGDGVLDLITANWCASVKDCSNGSVGVLLGNGDGTFKPAVTYPSGGYYAFSVLVADVNGDGKPDLVVANGCASQFSLCPVQSSVGVLIGNGDGSFQPVKNYDAGGSISGMAVADLNGDGKSDVIVADCAPTGAICWDVEGVVAVLLNNGDGTLAPAVTYDSGGKVASTITIADVNLDGHPDVLVGNVAACDTNDNCGKGSVGVLLGNGDGTLRPAAAFGSWWPYSVVVADLNGDGKPDLLTTTTNAGGDVSVLLGNGDGTFQAMVPYPLNADYQSPAIVADVNGDGKPDVLVGSFSCTNGTSAYGCVSVLLGRGDGTFENVVTYNSGAPVGGWLAVADINGDGKLDLIAENGCATICSAPGSLGVLLGNGDGTFQPVVTYSSGAAGTSWVGVADLNGDGKPDLVVASPSDTDFKVGVLLNNSVRLVPTTTTLVSSLDPSFLGQAVTFTAAVSSSAGTPPNGETITFYNGSAVLGVAPLSGGATSLTTSSLAAGIYTITAAYSGDANFAASTSNGLRQVVNTSSKSGTATALTSNLNPSIYGQKITWTATVTTSGALPPTGKVNFTWGGGRYSFGTAMLNSSGLATLTRSLESAGTYQLTAVYSGNANNLGSSSAALNQVITEATTSATLSSSPNPSTSGQSVTFTATIASPTITPTGPVTFTAGKTMLGTAQLSGGKVKFTTSTLAIGSTKVTATYQGDSNIAGSAASVTQTVQP
jgi:hypothetical protein